jgi:hypothetical protein
MLILAMEARKAEVLKARTEEERGARRRANILMDCVGRLMDVKRTTME